MIFDVYYPLVKDKGTDKERLVPGVKPHPTEWKDIKKLSESKAIRESVELFRKTGDAAFKLNLPAICYVGRCENYRRADLSTPTNLVMIDVDHVEDPIGAFEQIAREADKEWWEHNVLLCHITPSGHGLRIVFRAQEGKTTLEENMQWFNESFNLSQYGDFDAPCKDFCRLSFIFLREEILYESQDLRTHPNQTHPNQTHPSPSLVGRGEIRKALTNLPQKGGETSVLPLQGQGELEGVQGKKGNPPEISEEDKARFEAMDYRGTPLRAIIERYVEVNGKPGSGEIHNYYNELIKNFRNIMNNNKRALFCLLPRFGHSAEECWSSIVSITRANTLSQLPKSFYFFLKDNGFYKITANGSKFADYMMADKEDDETDPLPWMPPIFRELVGIAPKDFKLSVVNALLPILGTLTSFLKAFYYYDGREHTTSFFSVIYAPAGTGKGFVERFTDLLFQFLTLRDYVQQAREAVYLRTMSRKGANEKAPADPHTSLRIIPAKNSEAEFLQKQKDNQGYHMFTYAAEMDSWAKGAKAAGGNKDDMIRIAWDNGEYGQQYKSANTFKGTVRLFWNVLITGTIQQLLSYFKNVENGLITRCSFTTIDNQEFAAAPQWKPLSKKALDAIDRFLERCDRNSYAEPCEIVPEDLDLVEDAKFDEEVDWHFKFLPRKSVDMMWLKPTIDRFLEENMKRASLDYDKARDVFRRRVAVRGFRLGILCTALWENPRPADLERCIPFIRWWMDNDLASSLALWGARYNEAVEDAPSLSQRSLYNQLADSFDKNDVYVLCIKQGIKSPVRNITSQWVKLGVVEKVAKGQFKKIKK